MVSGVLTHSPQSSLGWRPYDFFLVSFQHGTNLLVLVILLDQQPMADSTRNYSDI